MAMQPVMMQPVAAAQPVAAGAPSVASGYILESPGLIRSILGAIGRRLARLGEPTLRMSSVQVQQLQTVAMPAAAPAPVAAAQPIAIPTAEAPPLPTPQGTTHHKHFFHR
jgi:hypothetical protein